MSTGRTPLLLLPLVVFGPQPRQRAAGAGGVLALAAAAAAACSCCCSSEWPEFGSKKKARRPLRLRRSVLLAAACGRLICRGCLVRLIWIRQGSDTSRGGHIEASIDPPLLLRMGEFSAKGAQRRARSEEDGNSTRTRRNFCQQPQRPLIVLNPAIKRPVGRFGGRGASCAAWHRLLVPPHA